jgi:hypothetical protein
MQILKRWTLPTLIALGLIAATLYRGFTAPTSGLP